MASRSYGQYCGVTTAVELVGERWAMLIVRDLLVGPRRYTDLKQGLPKIPTNILSTRLKELQEGGVVRRVPLMNCGLVYELTDYGRQLEPIVLALGRWGFAQMGEPGLDDVVTADSLTMALRTAFRSDAAASLPPADYEVHVGDVALRVQVDGGELRIAQLAPPPPHRSEACCRRGSPSSSSRRAPASVASSRGSSPRPRRSTRRCSPSSRASDAAGAVRRDFHIDIAGTAVAA